MSVTKRKLQYSINIERFPSTEVFNPQLVIVAVNLSGDSPALGRAEQEGELDGFQRSHPANSQMIQ